MFRIINPTDSVNFRYKNSQLFIDFESVNKVDTISLNKNVFNNKCLKLKNQGSFSLLLETAYLDYHIHRRLSRTF